MGIFGWLGSHWFELAQTLGIVLGLLFTARSVQVDAKARHVANLLAITQTHHEIWSGLYDRPRLSRVLDATANLELNPITPEEHVFVGSLILHLYASYQAMKKGMLISPEGLRKDIERFFSRPIPKAAWEKLKPLQDSDFVRFVEVGKD